MIALQESTRLQELFAPLSAAGVGLATAPILVLGIGVLVFLLCDIITVLKPVRSLVFISTIALSLVFELLILADPPAADTGLLLDGTLRVNATTALWGCIFLLGTLFAWVYSIGYYTQNRPFKPEHDALMLTAPAGMMLMVGAGNLVVFFVGLELLSIPLYALAAFRRARADSVEAGIKYFLLGSFSSAIFLYGAALLYAAHGTVYLAPHGGIDGLLARAGQPGFFTPLATAGVSLIAASLFFKVSVFPFHLWVPDVYEGSPTPVTALMATGTKAAAFGVLVGIIPLFPPGGALLVAWLALITMALGNLGALVQTNIKRMLAYSGISHAGTLLLVIAGGMAMGPNSAASTTEAALFYMGAYLFTATGAFGLLSLLESDGRKFLDLDNLRGLARSRPGVAAALTLFMLSLGGIPATGGFLGKFFVFSVLVDAHMVGIAVLGVLMSVVALGYYLRVIVVMYMQPAPEGEAAPTTLRPLTAGIATLVCCFFVLAMGVAPSFFLNLLH